MTTTLPRHEEAEQILLASMMHNPGSVPTAQQLVAAEDFSREHNRKLFILLSRLFDTHGLCDFGMVSDYLREQHDNDFTEYGGWEYLHSLRGSWLGSGVSLAPYARIIKEASCRRALQRIGEELINRAGDMRYETVPVADYAVQRIRESLPPSVQRSRPLYDIALEERERICQELRDGVGSGFKTGWAQLNRKLAPIRAGQLVVVGARPGMGKTAFAVNWALSLAEQDLPGVIYSLEMEESELSLRALLRYTNITNTELDNPSVLKEQAAGVMADIDKALEALPRGIRLNDRTLTINEIARDLRDLTQQGQAKWAMVDFLQLARADKHYRSRSEEVGAMAYELADMSKEFEIPIIALSQLSREVDKDSPCRPRKDHFLESGKIEAAAHRMLYLYRPSEYGPDEVHNAGFPKDYPQFTEVGILKQRNAKSLGKTVLYYDGDHYRFRDLQPEEKRVFGEAQ